jgi:hypothetical protein
MKSFWYEQSPALASGDIAGDVYKSGSGFIRDGQWHRLNPQSRAMYRVIPGYLQVVFRDEELESADPDADMSEILAAVESAGPLTLYENDQPEVLIRPVQGGGYAMTSHWIYLKTGAGFTDFTPEQWNDAYNRLSDLESSEE